MIKNVWNRFVSWLFSWQKEEKDPHIELYEDVPKSEIKVVESAHYGCIPVFSNFGGYKTMADQVPSNISLKGFAIDFTTPKAWINAISSHIDNYDETKKRALEFKEWSDSNYNINNHAEDRLSFYLRNAEEFQEDWYNQNIAQNMDY